MGFPGEELTRCFLMIRTHLVFTINCNIVESCSVILLTKQHILFVVCIY